MTERRDEPCEGRIDVECSARVWVLTLHGEHDISTQPTLREQLDFVYEAGGPVVVDLAHATFIDSTLLGAIAADWQGDGDEAVRLVLVAPTNYEGSRLIELVGVGRTIPVYPSRAGTVAALAD